jgi:hypothetical protein
MSLRGMPTPRLAVVVAALRLALPSTLAAAVPIDYSRDVRPILANNCFACHGNDPAHREAELRLDQMEAADEARGAEDVIDPGDPESSELVVRVTSEDVDVRMPPADSGKVLKASEIETLRQWIAEGAVYKKHWAFEAPRRSPVPRVEHDDWVRNTMDAFVLARLEREGLVPSPRAERGSLLRRLSLDLIGLPPRSDELKEFLADEESGAYKRAVERLLASPHFGERWARLWLDAARYADSDGFEKDKPRSVWMYRDWVINAFNADMPYDRFVIEQIAGDLLPEPSQEQLVATGFLRNSMINEEGGIDPEQFRMEAMFDRMDAIGKAVLGVTIQCAQCHSHKYDPLSQTDYYRMFAFLNNCDEGQPAVYTPQERRQWQATAEIIRTLEDQLCSENPEWQERMAVWEASVRGDQPTWKTMRPQLDASGDQKHYLLGDGSILAQGYAPTIHYTEFSAHVKAESIAAFRLELFNDSNLPRGGPGRSIDGMCALTEFKAFVAPADRPDQQTELTFKAASADVNPPERELAAIYDDKSGRRRVTGPAAMAIDGDDKTAWGIDVGPARSNVPRKAVFVLERPLPASSGVRISFHLVQRHGGWNSDDNQNNNLGRFRFSYAAQQDAKADPLPSEVRAIVEAPRAGRTADENQLVFRYWRTTVDEFAEANRRIEALWNSHPRGTTQLVLLERPTPRATHRLERGSFLAPAEEVSPGVPDFLHSLEDESPNRLSFARWLVDRRSPTTARAIVNRIWQAYFGVGLVGTSDDLGTQGDMPTHPELLDWLAVELMEHDWSLKHIHRLIVSSATYQQSSRVAPELLERDPANRLLARGARFRVDAEVVRDLALSASGLLTPTVGGPSVYPPAPEFLFKPPTSYGPKPWHFDVGPDKYRRAIYTTRYRSVPYPALQAFDAPTGEYACVRRVRSNTPLQALTTLNEPLFFECARALAVKTVADGGATDVERLTYAFERCVSRAPSKPELALLRHFLARQKKRFNREGADPRQMLIDEEDPQAGPPDGVSAADLAAWTAIARVVLNLDETITRE